MNKTIKAIPLFFPGIFLLFFILSCNKKIEPENGIEFTVFESEKQSIADVLSSAGNRDHDSIIQSIEELPEVTSVDNDEDFLTVSTRSGGCITVDLNGSSSTKVITASDKADTCGIYVSSLLQDKENSLLTITTEGVYSDPADSEESDVLSEEGDEDIETKALTIRHRKLMSKKKMAVWSPWDEFGLYDIPNFTRCVSNFGFQYTVISDCSPASFSSFNKYDLVYIGSHGSKKGGILLPPKYWDVYLKNYVLRVVDGIKIIDEEKAVAEGIHPHFDLTDDGEVLEAVCLEEAFFRKYLPDLSHTIIWTAACHLGRSNSAFLRVSREKKCPEFYGADNVCNGIGPMSVFWKYVPFLASGASAKTAYDFSIKHIVKTLPYNYVRYGEENVSYLVPFITGVRESAIKTAVLGVRFQYSLDIPESRDSNTPNEFGIRLENLDSHKIEDIPLSNSFIDNVRCYNEDNWYCVYLADVHLNNLIPETRYRYRTYVKVAGIKQFSRLTQEFSTRGLTGLWSITVIYPEETIPAREMTREFYEYPFDGQSVGANKAFSTTISGNAITFKEWPTKPPFYGECGGEKSFYYSGSIDDTWSHIAVIGSGFIVYATPREDCVGSHRHNWTDHTWSYDMVVVPSKYNYIR